MPHETVENETADDATFGDIESASTGEDQDLDLDIHQDNWDIPIETKSSNKKSTDQSENLDVEEGEITATGTKIDKKAKKDEELTDEELEAKETKTAADKAASSKAAAENLENSESVPVGKLLKAKVGDKEVTIDDGAVVRHKVDGKMVEVKISDALKEYSGRTNYDKKFQEVAEERKTVQATAEKVHKYEAHLKEKMGEVNRLVKEAVEGKEGPFKAMKYLLDIQGQDSFVYYKKAMESMFDEFVQLYDMDEKQQQAYWTAKENEHLREQQTRISRSQQVEQENQKVLSQVETAHKEFGVNWDQFNEALEYLASLKDERGKPVYQEKNLVNNPRAVAQYAARMPYITKADALIKQFEENIGDDEIVALTDEVSKLLHESKGANEADVLEWLETNYGVSKAVKALNQKVQKTGGGPSKEADELAKWKARTKQKAEDEVEDWDDLDIEA